MTSPSPERTVPAVAEEANSQADHAQDTRDDASPEPSAKSDVASKTPPTDSDSSADEEGEIDETQDQAPPLPDGPPLPQEPPPNDDDGWDCLWDAHAQAWYFHNRFTNKTQWDNPRVPVENATTKTTTTAAPPLPAEPVSGYNPAIHGDYDPNAWYAQKYNQDEPAPAPEIPSMEDGAYAATAGFNRFTGQFQQEDMGPGRHTDESKSKRQMNVFFDVDAAANVDDGRSLKAERSNKRISKSELKAFKEKRRARKEEKRRAWLRD